MHLHIVIVLPHTYIYSVVFFPVDSILMMARPEDRSAGSYCALRGKTLYD